ncbi:hypothetical protein HDIA_0777 [Hartmannibacter diazotrophicus]|uniref:Uncharacterized protein n=1 Tax=Hartmannibacter diazotrophicus TaxID=1482074 RepID=A0A2C9D2D2_9HYPH|nr:hypothetical protein [Hartmannibacter diazotrophicus]SON54318.1 hypothetical protein HDIA_0777 [Hartmannibacter diazotrophicus]
MGSENYVLGRGEVLFGRFKDGTQTPEGYRYLGNTPEFGLTIESQAQDHYNSDRGIREKDLSITLEVNRTGQMVADEIDLDNLSYFFFSAAGKETVAQAGGAVTGFSIPDAIPGRTYQLGESASNPIGDLNIAASGFVVNDDTTPTPVTFTAGDDYVLDGERGHLTIVEGGAITEGTNLEVDYTVTASSYDRVLSGSEKVEGALKFITRNATGPDRVFTMPHVTLAPNGDYNLKGDDWQQIPFTLDILRKGNLEAIYLNGLPYVPA